MIDALIRFYLEPVLIMVKSTNNKHPSFYFHLSLRKTKNYSFKRVTVSSPVLEQIDAFETMLITFFSYMKVNSHGRSDILLRPIFLRSLQSKKIPTETYIIT